MKMNSHRKTMWHQLSLATLLLTTGVSQAALIAYEPFTTGAGGYSTGTITLQNPTVAGFTGAWANNSGWGTGATISSTGLTYPGLQTTGGMYVGAQSRSYRELATPFDNSTVGTYWMSFLLQKTATGTSSWQAVEFYGASGIAGEDGSRVSALTNSWGPVGNNFRADDTGLLGATDTNVNLFVYKIDFVAGGNDTVTVWRNPSLASEPVSGGVTYARDFSTKYIGVFDWNVPGALNFDELRIGTSFASVIPEPHAALLGGLGMLALLRRRR